MEKWSKIFNFIFLLLLGHLHAVEFLNFGTDQLKEVTTHKCRVEAVE